MVTVAKLKIVNSIMEFHAIIHEVLIEPTHLDV